MQIFFEQCLRLIVFVCDIEDVQQEIIVANVDQP